MKSRTIPYGTIAVLERVHWDFFITIPLPHRKTVGADAREIWNGFYNRLATARHVKARRMVWAVWLEYGKSGNNPHLHATISSREIASSAGQTKKAIREIRVGMRLPGKIDVRVFRKGLNTFEYLCKEQDSPLDDESRLHNGCWPMTSDSLWETLRRRHDSR